MYMNYSILALSKQENKSTPPDRPHAILHPKPLDPEELPFLIPARFEYSFFPAVFPIHFLLLVLPARTLEASKILAASEFQGNRSALLSISDAIESRKRDYYDALEQAQRSNVITEWIRYFVSTILNSEYCVAQVIFLLNLAVLINKF